MVADATATQLTNLSATEIARLVNGREVSVVEVVEAHIRRIEAVNPRLNAVVVTLFEEARAQASSADAFLRQGGTPGPLFGVPITVKEAFHVAGTAVTMGLSERRGKRSSKDGILVTRLKEAGAILLGKTNVPQLLMTNETDNPVYGRANNPWDTQRSPGGSSGGEGAIIAAGGSALGLGSDIGGSIRLPAHVCGIHGFKPTPGRLTMEGHARLYAGQEAILAQPGPLARSVADLQTAFGVLAQPGQEAADHAMSPAPPVDLAEVELRGLRVGMYVNNGVIEPAPALRRAVRDAADALRARGVEVQEWTPPDASEAWDTYLRLLFADGMKGAKRVLGKSKPDWRIRRVMLIASFPNSLVSLYAKPLALLGQHHLSVGAKSTGSISADKYWQLVEHLRDYRARFVAALDAERLNAIICPPDALPALTHGSSFYLSDALSYGALYNLLGFPAGVVAATRVRAGEESDRVPGLDLVERAARSVEEGSAGLPVGVMVASLPWKENVALALMAALEQHFKKQQDYPARPPL